MAALLGAVSILLVVCFLLLTFITQTSFFRQWLKKTIIHQTQKKVGLTLSMDKIEGNLLTGLTVHHLLLKSPAEELRLDQFRDSILSYGPFSRRLTFPLLSLSGLKMTIVRTKEGDFRVLPFPPFPSPPSAPKAGKPEIPSFSFHFHTLRLQEGSILFQDYFHQKQGKETVIQKIGADLSFDYFPQNKDATWQAQINNLSFALLKPYTLTVKNSQGDISHQPGIFEINNLEIKTQASRFQFQGRVKVGEKPFFQIKSRFPHISLPEVQRMSPTIHFPPQLHQLTSVQGEAEIRGTLADLTFSLLLATEIEKQPCQCLAKGKLDLSDITLPHYQVQAGLKRLPVTLWLPKKRRAGLPRAVDLHFRIQGKGIKLQELSTDFDVSLSPFTLFDQPIEAAGISGQLEKESLKLTRVKIRGPAGLIQMQGQIDLAPPLPYQLILSFEHIDPAKVPIKGFPPSRFEGEIRLRGVVGQKFPKNFQSSGSLHLFPSRLGERFIDDLLLEGDYEAEKLRLSQGKVHMQGVDFSLQGTIFSPGNIPCLGP